MQYYYLKVLFDSFIIIILIIMNELNNIIHSIQIMLSFNSII